MEKSKAISKKVLVCIGNGEGKDGLVVGAMSFGSFEPCNVVWIEIKKETINKNEEALNMSLVGR